MATLSVPSSAFDAYLEEINRFPLLTKEEEYRLAKRLEEKDDVAAAQKLVTSNLRFVVKIAYEYRNYNVRVPDLVQEGNIGLMKAVKKFNPERGYRLISYAVWWIKAYMQNFISRNQRMVRIPGSRPRLLPARTHDDQTGQLDVPLERASASPAALRDFSLDAVMDEDGKRTFLDLVASEAASQEEDLAQEQTRRIVADQLEGIWKTLNPKEEVILRRRMLSDEPLTLQEIGEQFGISRERVRQIEQALRAKLRKILTQSESLDVTEGQ